MTSYLVFICATTDVDGNGLALQGWAGLTSLGSGAESQRGAESKGLKAPGPQPIRALVEPDAEPRLLSYHSLSTKSCST